MFQQPSSPPTDSLPLEGRLVLLVGRFAAASRKETERLIRSAGGKVTDGSRPGINLIVLGEGVPLGTDWLKLSGRLDKATRYNFERGNLETIPESELYKRTGQSDPLPQDRPLYTESMLAELTSVPLSSIRKWRRLGLLVDVRRVGRLPYFDVEGVLAASQVKRFQDSGTKPERLRQILELFEKRYPTIRPILPKLQISQTGGKALLAVDHNLYDTQGQLFFDLGGWEANDATTPNSLPEESSQTEKETAAEPPFSEQENEEPEEDAFGVHFPAELFQPFRRRDAALRPGPDDLKAFQTQVGKHILTLCEEAWTRTEEGKFQEAAQICHVALCLGGADAGISFQLAEILALAGDLTAARERYYMVLEMEEDHLEARTGLGRVMVQLGEYDQAIELFQGALIIDPDYLDIRYELGTLLFMQKRYQEAEDQLLHIRRRDPNSTRREEIEQMLLVIRQSKH